MTGNVYRVVPMGNLEIRTLKSVRLALSHVARAKGLLPLAQVVLLGSICLVRVVASVHWRTA